MSSHTSLMGPGQAAIESTNGARFVDLNRPLTRPDWSHRTQSRLQLRPPELRSALRCRFPVIDPPTLPRTPFLAYDRFGKGAVAEGGPPRPESLQNMYA